MVMVVSTSHVVRINGCYYLLSEMLLEMCQTEEKANQKQPVKAFRCVNSLFDDLLLLFHQIKMISLNHETVTWTS